MSYSCGKVRAVIFMADGFEEIEAIAVFDVLRRADIRTALVSVMSDAQVTGAHGLELICDSIFDSSINAIEDADILILPGGGDGTENLMRHEGLGSLLGRFNSRGKLLAAICAAPSVLGRLGILDGRTAVCFPGYESELLGAEIANSDVVVSSNIITAKAAGAAIDFALEIVRALVDLEGLSGSEVSSGIKSMMFYR